MAKKRRRSEHVEEEPPAGCYHYRSKGELEYDLQNYFAQRYSLFSAYDDGIWMTEEAWFGVTPEPVANAIASHVAEIKETKEAILVDAFAGVGGNVIAFARANHFQTIYAFERDAATLACAKHNAKIYGVDDQIHWSQGDCFELLLDLYGSEEDVIIFASPPWGGPSYRAEGVFDLSEMHPYGLANMMTAFSKVTENIVLYLPRTSDLRQLAEFQAHEKIEVVHYCMDGASKALCAYFGSIFTNLSASSEVQTP